MFTFCARKQCFFALSDLCSHFVQENNNPLALSDLCSQFVRENNISLALIDLCSQFARETMFLWL